MNSTKRFDHFANWLRELRAKQGLTQKALGDAIDIHSQFVSNAERALCRLPAEKVVKLVKLYGNSKTKTHIKQVWMQDEIRNVQEYVDEVFG